MHITFTDFTLLSFTYIKIFSHKYVVPHHFGVVSSKSPATLLVSGIVYDSHLKGILYIILTSSIKSLLNFFLIHQQ